MNDIIFQLKSVTLGVLASLAIAGDVDLSFGNQGKVITDFFNGTDVGNSLLIDADGKIVLAGSASKRSITDHHAIARFTSDGSLDRSFGGTGKVAIREIPRSKKLLDGEITGAGFLSDGSVVTCGRGAQDGVFGLALVAYTQQGALKPSLGGDGAVIVPDDKDETYPLALVVDRNDNIIVAASAFHNASTASFALFRFKADGVLDESFGRNGKVLTRITAGTNVPRAIKIDRQGNIVVGGFNGDSKFVVARYYADGALDPSFGVNGIATITFNDQGIDTLNALAIQADGKIVVGGDVQVASIGGIRSVDFGLARLTSDGQLDLTFNKTGKQITYFAGPAASSLWALAVQENGKVVAVGDASLVNGLGVARYHVDGSLDESFGVGGKQIVSCGKTCHWQAVALQEDEKIVAGGYVWNGKHYDMALVRIINDKRNQL